MLKKLSTCKQKKTKQNKTKQNKHSQKIFDTEMKTFEKSTCHLQFDHFLNPFFVPYFPLQIRALKCLDHIKSYNKFD